LPATILDATGLADPVGFPGKSLARHWRPTGSGPAVEPIFAEAHRVIDDVPARYPTVKGKLRAVIADGMQYIRHYGDSREELFDVIQDPLATRDLAPVKPDDLGIPRSRLDQLR
jgi:arylsulfatase A-like enzyme